MSTSEFQNFLEKLKKEAEPNAFALVEMSYVKDATICHGFGAACMPVIDTNEVIGILRSKDAIAPRSIEHGLVSLTKSIFDVCLAEDERGRKWVSPANCHDYSMLQDADFAISPNAKLEISKVENKGALRAEITTKSLNFWDEIHNKTEVPITLSGLSRDGGVSYDAFKLISKKKEATVYLGKKAILDYLVATKNPLELLNALHQLNPSFEDIPQELNEKAKVEAKKIAISFHKAAEVIFKKETEFIRESLLTWAASGEGRGVIAEKERVLPAIERDKDYTKVMSKWHVGALKDDFSRLDSKVKEMKELNVPSFVTTLEPRPWAEINLEILIKYVEQRAAKYEARFKEFEEKLKQ
jgi:hypothetical protein